MTGSNPSFLALACVGFIASLPAHAADRAAGDPVVDQAQPRPDEARRDDDVVVTGEAYQPEQETPKATRPVRDTPQTITIITNETIEQQNLLTLRDVLSTVPGITFGAGEGGGGFGDSISLRGFSANSDITVDGVRDSAQYTRTDPFNLEQLEVVSGPNSVQNGAGSVGGSINLVTKRPLDVSRIEVQGGIGTDEYYRATMDANLRASEMIAFRLNAMVHQNDVPGRDVERYERWGVAPAITIDIGGPTWLTIQYVHQEDENTPQYGVPYYRTASNAGPIPGVYRSDYFGFRNVDRQDITVDQLTLIAHHDFSDTVSIRNLARWQQVDQFTLVNPPQGTYCLADGLTPSGGACTATIATQVIGTTSVSGGTLTVPPGYYLPSGPRGTTRDSRNELIFDQVDLNAEFNTGGLQHTLVIGAAAAWEKYGLSSGNSLRNTNGTPAFAYYPLVNFGNPNQLIPGPAATSGLTRLYGSNVYTGPVNYIESARQTGELTNYAVYLFDTIRLVPGLELTGGIRWESNEGSYRADTVSTATATLGQVTRGQTYHNDEELLSYRVGLVYKPIEAVSIYAGFGNSTTPSKTSVNGSCTEQTCTVDPETARNYEVGVKAELSGGLLLTAALFRNERTNYKVATGDPIVPEQQLDGQSRVDGVALGGVGRITRAWSITANYTYLDSEVIRSIARNSPAGTIDPQRGNPLVNVPEHSGSLFTVYELPFGLSIGYGVTYQGGFYLNNSGATLFETDDFWMHNAYVAFNFTDRLTAQVNVKNVGDDDYYTRIRNNGWATPGEARSAILTVRYRM